MAELASGAKVLNYFDQVMHHRLLATGRVRYFPMSDLATGPDGARHFSPAIRVTASA